MTSDLSAQIAGVERSLAKAFDAADRAVFLAFSGGKESMALLDLCRPYEGRFRLMWMNAGFQFPHVEAMIRDLGERYGLIELSPLPEQAIADVWRERGLPSEHFAVSDVLPGEAASAVRLMPYVDCCRIVRWEPSRGFSPNRRSRRWCCTANGWRTVRPATAWTRFRIRLASRSCRRFGNGRRRT